MKIAVCVPVHGDPKASFTRCAFDLGVRTMAGISPQLLMFMGRGTILPSIRNDIAAEALKWDAHWLLWLDADHTFPPDALLRLLAHGVPIVGCNYPKRRADSDLPTATRAGSHIYTTNDKAERRAVEEVDSLGLGVCLVRADVFRALKGPWFRFEYDARGDFATEDAVFFGRARAAGFRVLVDHAVSWEVGHIDEKILTNSATGRGYVRTTIPSARPG